MLLIATAQRARAGTLLTPRQREGAELCHESPKAGYASSACPPGLQLERMFNGFSVFFPQAKTLPASTDLRHVLQGVGFHILQGTGFHVLQGVGFHDLHWSSLVPCSPLLPTPGPSQDACLSLSTSRGGAACRTQSQPCSKEPRCPLSSCWMLSPSDLSQNWLKKRGNLP